jgi:hypothetical protein
VKKMRKRMKEKTKMKREGETDRHRSLFSNEIKIS